MKTGILKALSQYVDNLKKQSTLIVPYVFFTVWALFTFISNVYFESSMSVIDSCIFMVTLFSIMFVVLFCGVATAFSLVELRRRRVVFFCATGFAIISLIVMMVLPPSMVKFVLAGALAGLGLALLILIFETDFLGMEQRMGLATISSILLLSAVLFLLALWLIDSEMVIYALLLFLLAAAILYYRFTTHSPNIDAVRSVLSRNLQMVAKSVRTELFLLLLATGFLAGFLLTLFPRTTHYAGVLSDSFLGRISAIALLALILCAVILTVFTIGWGRGGQFLSLAFLIVLILFAGICMTVPSMGDNSLPFILITPVAVVALLLAQSLFNQIELLKAARNGWRVFGGCFVSMAGSLVAALLNLFFFIPIEQGVAPPFYPDVVIVSSIILILFLFVLLRKNLTQLLFPAIQFNEPLDTSDMANRCKMLANIYGLTFRERELLAFFSEGRDIPYIEKALMISRSTVKTHTTHIYQKVGVASRQELLDLLHNQPHERK